MEQKSELTKKKKKKIEPIAVSQKCKTTYVLQLSGVYQKQRKGNGSKKKNKYLVSI